MKAILEFKLPEESHEHLTAVHARALSSALWDMDQELRRKIKYASEDTPELVTKTFQEARDILTEILEHYGILEVIEA